MDFFRKVKSRELPAEAVLWIIMAPLLFVVILLFGFGFLLIVPIGLVYGITNLILFIQSRNWGYIIMSIFFLLTSALAVTLAFHRYIDPAWILTFAITWVTGLGAIIYMGLNRNIKWWSYEILELAARPVEEVRDGYTTRPLPVGKIAYQRDVMRKFVQFIRRNLIAIPVIESDKIVFLIAHTRFKMLTAGHYYSQETYICFHDTGNVTVNIAQEDYQKYHDTYAFDQLCEHLGRLFIDFYNHYEKGEKEMIMNKLKTIYEQ